VPLTVHWDGKPLSDLTGKELVDRLPVILSGAGVKQLIGVPKLATGTGKAQAQAVVQQLEEWQVTDQVGAMCFDSTASNTGKNNGACVLIEQKLDKKLLHFACRHHIFELLLASVFKETIGVSVARIYSYLSTFNNRQQWPYIDQHYFQSGLDHPTTAVAIMNHKDSMISFGPLNSTTPR